MPMTEILFLISKQECLFSDFPAHLDEEQSLQMATLICSRAGKQIPVLECSSHIVDVLMRLKVMPCSSP